MALLLIVAAAPPLATAESLCESCELQVGIGDTYHFWGSTGGVVVPITLNWSDSRYEVGLFRVSRRQILYDAHYPNGRLMADPYWGMSLSRRWRVFTRGPVRGFFGFGLAAKTESDQLSITRLDFASQFGVRFPLPGNRVIGELTFRHWSNGGIRLPNHGQDFVTLTFRVNSGLFGVDSADRVALNGVADFKGQNSDDVDTGNLP
ncbi:MAG: acyloxyacyl hydrolase [Gammaproteobacteria bacterium]|nr:acyloxyacyl hydrolase [Gammaproteobacteria bacterium]MBV8306583.1 acyloxyacyl hydrolase [Gammaproteobacteria bacterium]